jgi:penicillin amidase
MEWVNFGIDGSFNTTKIKNAKEIPQEYAAISKSVAAILDQSPVSPFIGSNGWVVQKKLKRKKSFCK